MIVLIARMKAKPGYEKVLAEGCVEMANLVREKEKDCLMYTPYVSVEDPSEIVMIEKYTNEKAIKYHMQTRYFLDAMPKLKEILEAPMDIQQLQEEPNMVTF